MTVGKTIQSAVLPLPQMYERWQEWANALLMLLKQQEAQGDNPSTFTGGDQEVPQLALQADFDAAHDSDPGVFIYLGQAEPGSATSAAVWRIKRFRTDSDPEIQGEYAGGDENFDNIYDNRTALAYS